MIVEASEFEPCEFVWALTVLSLPFDGGYELVSIFRNEIDAEHQKKLLIEFYYDVEIRCVQLR